MTFVSDLEWNTGSFATVFVFAMIDTLTVMSFEVHAAVGAVTLVPVVKCQTVTFATVDKITFVDASLIGGFVQIVNRISTAELEIHPA